MFLLLCLLHSAQVALVGSGPARGEGQPGWLRTAELRQRRKVLSHFLSIRSRTLCFLWVHPKQVLE